MVKAQLWEIAVGATSLRWTDDEGGTLFVSRGMAQRTFDKYTDALTRVGASIVPCDLDDDLAQMGKLYHEGKH